MARRGEWVYDELLCYVSSPLFQAPVMSFMEANCLIFDPSLDDCNEYREIHGAYCALVTVLLDAFRQDTSLTHEQIIKAMAEMSKKSDLREVFSGLFELILATESFQLFSRLMTQKNLELQQQALMLIMKQLGHLPESMQLEDQSVKKVETSSKPSSQSFLQPTYQPPPQPTNQQTTTNATQKTTQPIKPPVQQATVARQEHEIFSSVIKSAPVEKSVPAEKEEIKKSADVESSLLKVEQQKEQERLVNALKNLDFEEEKAQPVSVTNSAEVKALPRLTTRPVPAVPSQPVKAPTVTVSSTDAAAGWIAQAKAENDTEAVNAVQNAAATFAQMSPDELKKRQEYLKQQREKLMAMKQKEREKQLDTYEKSVPQSQSRPRSARVARSVLTRATPAETPASEEDQKTLQMRRAIANRLKAEIIESQQ